MKTNSLLYLLILGLIIQTSCKSTEEITMFKESIEDNAPVRIYKSAPAEHRINLFDNLFIRILTLDPEVNKLYNPGMAENAVSTDQMFGSPTGQYINGYRVGADSMISLPMLGEINLVGLNLKEAEALITEKAKEDLKEPVVQVKLLNFKIDILGEVSAPGIYYNFEENLNIVDAIAMSGGITNYANLKEVIVNRQTGNITNTYKIDVSSNKLYQSDVYYLQPNDVVYIPPSRLIRRNENVGNYSLVLSTLTSILVIITFLGINP